MRRQRRPLSFFCLITDGLLRVFFCSSCIALDCICAAGRAGLLQTDAGHGPLTGAFSPDDHLLQNSPSNYKTQGFRQRFSPTFILLRPFGFFTSLSIVGSSYHARVRPASTKSNAMPLENQREKRNDVGRKFMSWKQKIYSVHEE